MKILFWTSIFAVVYVYMGYPIMIYLLSMLRERQTPKGNLEPKITILISAYNEESNIEETIRNKLNLNYPRGKMEIIVISDGSTDKTEEIVKNYEVEGVKLLKQNPRSGKTMAFNMAVPNASGDILVFSDANSMYDADAIKMLIKNFSDPSVGYVTGKMIYTNPDGTAMGDGCNTYMKYENFLRYYETNIGSVVGVDGGIDAVRKRLYQPMNPDQLPDFVLPLKVVEQGFRVIYEPKAILMEKTLSEAENEYRMRVRVSLRSFWALYDMLRLFNFKKYGLFSWQLLSHKLLRYLCFIFLLSIYISNLFLWSESMWWKASFILQSAFYVSAIVAYAEEKLRKRIGILYLPYFFTVLNLASGHAFIKFILGQKIVTWVPRKG